MVLGEATERFPSDDCMACRIGMNRRGQFEIVIKTRRQESV